MAIKIKTIAESTEKWQTRAMGAADVYTAGAEAAADLWEKNTVGAQENYRLGITAAGVPNRFGRGVKRAGAAKFARKIREVARDRFAPGIGAATEDYKSRVEPFFSTIAALTLSARKPRGDPSNYRRVEEVGKALNAKRLAQLAGGS